MAIKVVKAEIKELPAGNPMNTHGIELTLEITAPNAKAIEGWLKETNNRLRAFAPVPLARDGGVRAP